MAKGPMAMTTLPGIPIIRVFEALASGSPLISAPWEDCERWFRPEDYSWRWTDGRCRE